MAAPASRGSISPQVSQSMLKPEARPRLAECKVLASNVTPRSERASSSARSRACRVLVAISPAVGPLASPLTVTSLPACPLEAL